MNLDHTLLKIGCIFGLALFVTGCATVDSVKSPVRKVEFKKVPEVAGFADHVRQYATEMYPKVWELFADDGKKPPEKFDVVIGPLKSGRSGTTLIKRWGTSRIWINTGFITNYTCQLETLNKVLVHEMTHVALLDNASLSSKSCPFGWVEGLADYAFYKLVGTNGWGCPECNIENPHYTFGYSCAGAFLLYVESRFGSNVIQQLSAEIRRQNYSDAFFAETTGKSLDILWADFQNTPAFKPGITNLLALYQELGFVGPELPRNAVVRFNKYLEKHANEFTRAVFESDAITFDSKLLKDVRSLAVMYLYFSQPGGSAEEAFFRLGKKNHGWPGIAESDIAKAKYPRTGFDLDFSRDWPFCQICTQSRTIDVNKDGDTSYHYTMERATMEDGWKMTKAWRTSAGGKVIEEFPVP